MRNQSELPARSKLIADLTRGIEELTLRLKKPDELQGLLADAKVLVQEWKIKEPSGAKRPLFDSTAQTSISLLAGLVVALRQSHRLIERMRRHFPDELEQLLKKSLMAEGMALASAWWNAKESKLTRAQKYEQKRNEVRLPGVGLIGYEFSVSIISFHPLRFMEPTCLDDIFRGKTVTMPRLVELFGVERHRLLKLASGTGDKTHFSWRSIVKILDTLLSEQPRKPCRTKPGRPRRKPWLHEPDRRRMVLQRIRERLNTFPVSPDVKSEFETVVRHHLDRIG